MVMHARKSQRINDGYFEKHQAHPYQNSKYSNSKGGYSERYNDREMRDSPNGNSYRCDSPETASPRDRPYSSKQYMHKTGLRDKERDARDFISSRDKYSDCSRSPKDKRRDDGRGTHEERVQRVGEWTEHISSSGKKYYYNCKTEVSQWEKPREWLDRERRHLKEPDPRYLHRVGHEKHSTPRAGQGSGSSGSRPERNDSSTTSAASLMVPPWGRNDADDMDISPSNSTPRSDPERRSIVGNSTATGPANCSPAVATSHTHLASPLAAAASAASNAPLIVPPVVSSASALPRLSMPPSNNISKADEPAPLTIEMPGGGAVDPGPPTPTHSETHDATENRKLGSPVNNASGPGPAVSSSLLALRPTVPHLTPSLGNYFRSELTDHINDWPVHAIEKQVMKVSEELHTMTSIHCARVSSELKTARAVVRLTEIQATLQEQRILFLRQQIKALEELNTHSFMGD